MTTVPLPSCINISILSNAEAKLLNMLWDTFLKYPAPEIERERFIKALKFAYRQHTKTRRKSGESYFIHDLRCANRALISGCELNMATIMLCHEFVEDDGWSYQRLYRNFGREIADVVVGASKPPPIFASRAERLEAYLRILEKAIGKGGYYWKVLLEKLFDRHDNSHDTAGLNQPDQEQLFGETEQKFLPLFSKFIDRIPPTLLPFCRLMIFEIIYACANYRQSVSNHNHIK